MLKEIIYLQNLNRRVCSSLLLLPGFIMALSGCREPKAGGYDCYKLKANDPKIVEIANKYVLEKGEDLKNLFEDPEVTENKEYWNVIYDNKKMWDLGGDLSIIIDRKTCQPHIFNDCYELKTGNPKIIEMANKFAVEAGENLSVYKIPRVSEYKEGWAVEYDRQDGFYSELKLTISRTTCRVRYVPQR